MSTTLRSQTSRIARAGLLSAFIGLIAAIEGCEQKEKVLDIKAPGFDIEVNKTTTGKREVEIKSNRKETIEIETSK